MRAWSSLPPFSHGLWIVFDDGPNFSDAAPKEPRANGAVAGLLDQGFQIARESQEENIEG